MTWRSVLGTIIKDYHLVNVSIYMLKRDPPPEGLAYNIDITDDLFGQGWTDANNSLVKSVWDIYTSSKTNASTFANYNCRHAGTLPPECEPGVRHLRFRFEYSPVRDSSPWGEIVYNFAVVDNSADGEDSCLPSTTPLTGGWNLFFFETHHWLRRPNASQPRRSEYWSRVNVSQPFRKAYTSPMPKYKRSIDVCTDAGDDFDRTPDDDENDGDDDDGDDCDDDDDDDDDGDEFAFNRNCIRAVEKKKSHGKGF